MADTNTPPNPTERKRFIESDGISYRGLVIFVVILAVRVLCQGIVVGMFKFMDARAVESTRRAP